MSEGPAGEREGVRCPAHSREHPESTDRPRLRELFACQLDEREKIVSIGGVAHGAHRDLYLLERPGEVAELVVVARIYAGGEIPQLYGAGAEGETLHPPAEEGSDEQHQATPDYGGYGGGLHVAAGEDLQHRRLVVTRDERHPGPQLAVPNDRHGGDPSALDAFLDTFSAGCGSEDAGRGRGHDPLAGPPNHLSLAVYQQHRPARGVGDGLHSPSGFVRVRLLDGAGRTRCLGQRVILRVLAETCPCGLQTVEEYRAFGEQHDEHGHRRHPYAKPESH